MAIGEDTLFGRATLALEAIEASSAAIKTAVEGILAKVAAVEGGEYVEVAKDIGAGHADVALTAEELKATVIKLTGAGDQGFKVILSAGVKKLYLIDNQSGQEATVKYAASAGTAVAATKRSWLWSNGTDVLPATVA